MQLSVVGYLIFFTFCHQFTSGMEEKLTREERRRRRRATPKYRKAHASRERVRVEAFNGAFTELRSCEYSNLKIGPTYLRMILKLYN